MNLIEPMGFAGDDRRVSRPPWTGIDYFTAARHADFDAFRASIGAARLVLFTTRSSSTAYVFGYAAGVRSLNVATSAALGNALR